jgi:hypothetical protein
MTVHGLQLVNFEDFFGFLGFVLDDLINVLKLEDQTERASFVNAHAG